MRQGELRHYRSPRFRRRFIRRLLLLALISLIRLGFASFLVSYRLYDKLPNDKQEVSAQVYVVTTLSYIPSAVT